MTLLKNNNKLKISFSISRLYTNKSSQPEINMSISFKIHHKIWLNLNKESKSYKINSKYWKTKALKNTKLYKITIISNSFKFTKEIKLKLNLISMSWKKNKRKNLLIKTLIKFKNLTWSSYLYRKTCKISGYSMKKLVKTEIILVFSLSIETMSFVFYIKNPMYKKTSFVNLKLLSKIFKMIFVW